MVKFKQSGVTLLELLLALVLIAAFLLAITRIYQVVEGNYKVNQASNIALTLYQAAAQYQELPTTGDLLTDFVDKGYVPKEYADKGSNPWGGDIAATALAVNKMQTTQTSVPDKLCQNLRAKFTRMNNVTTSCDIIVGADTATFTATFTLDDSNAT